MNIIVDNDNAIEMGSYQKNMIWDVDNTGYDAYVLTYGPISKYSVVEFHFHFQRNPVFYGTLLIFSISLITALMIFTFVLPAESGEFLFSSFHIRARHHSLARGGAFFRMMDFFIINFSWIPIILFQLQSTTFLQIP